MDKLKIKDLKNILEKKQDNSISIFIPTHKEWNNADQNLIRFKNHIQQIEKDLLDRNLRENEIIKLLKPALDLMNEKSFWSHQSAGLAVFISPAEFHYYHLPVELKESQYISDKFYIKPILPYFNVDGSFYILTLDLNKCELYKASHYQIEKINFSDKTPVRLPDELRWDEDEKSLQLHTGVSAGLKKQASSRTGIFHGHGAGGMDERIHKEKILEFFRDLNDGVFEKIGSENLPLIIAGLDYLIPIYREANTYPNIFHETVNTDPQALPEDELKDKSWELVKPDFIKRRETAFEKYRQLSGNHLASSIIEEVVKAAYNKRIESLFINPYKSVWGKFNPAANEIQIDNRSEPGNDDLLDLAASYTILNNGFIYALEQDKMPCDKSVAAVFRY